MPGSLSSALQAMYFGFDGLLIDEAPLHAGREAGAAAAAQARRLDQVDERVRLHRQRLPQPFVALVLQEEVERVAVRLADVFREDWFHVDRIRQYARRFKSACRSQHTARFIAARPTL